MKLHLSKPHMFKSDILLIIAATFAIYIQAETFLVMGSVIPEPILPLWLLWVFFAIIAVLYVLGINIARRKHGFKHNQILLWVMVLVVIIASISIFVQKEYVTFPIEIRASGTIVDVTAYIPFHNKSLFFIDWINIMLVVYTGLVYLPHRVKTIKFTTFITYAYYLLMLISIIYSLINELDKYGELFGKIFSITTEEAEVGTLYGIKSFYPNHNVFAMLLELTMISSFITLFYRKKKLYLIGAIISYLLLLLTVCKTGILVTTLLLIIYFIYVCILAVKRKIKRAKLYLIISIAIPCAITAALLSLFFISDNFKQVLVDIFRDGFTFYSRTVIWENSCTILSPLWWLIGRGYGTYNLMLYNANVTSTSDYTAYSHSWFFSTLGRGGVLCTLFFICLITLTIYLTIRLYKKNKFLIVSIFFGSLLFFSHSFMEDNYYFTFYFLVLLAVLANGIHIGKRKETAKITQEALANEK